jgi:hypothetical protein
LSQIVSIKTEVRDAQAVAEACRRLGLPEPVNGTATLFSGEVAGLLVKLPDWLYPVVFDPATGQVQYDNYEGVWGDRKHLDRFMQVYAVEWARLEARKRGHNVVEQASGWLDQADHQHGGCLVKTIEITVSPTGESRVQTRGFAGGECREASRFIEQALGRRTAETLTSEFHEGQQNAQELKQSQ